MAEQRNFRMDPNLLLKVIKQQAGTLSKAILEGVMNAADAGATACRINCNSDTLTIEDDGRGFRDREEIENFFEVFGKPHEDSEEKIYGEFRMGRGQLFSFGRNEWRTTRFRMIVDIKHRGLAYDLHEDLKPEKGCKIVVSLYDKLGLTGSTTTRKDVERWCHYAPVDVYYNGDLVNKNPRIEDWTHDKPFAYIRTNDSGTWTVFNMGVFVCDIPSYNVGGKGGIVISKQKLSLNFARNEVMNDCPVWKKIKAELRPKEAKEAKANATKPQAKSPEAIVANIEKGTEAAATYDRKPLFTTIVGRKLTPNEVCQSYRWPVYTVVPVTDYKTAVKNKQLATMLHKKGIALCFTQDTLKDFGKETLPELLLWIKTTFAADYDKGACSKPVVAFDKLCEGFGKEFTVLTEEELSAKERLWLELLENTKHLITAGKLGSLLTLQDRVLQLGTHATQLTWTDGCSYVTLNRSALAKLDFDIYGIFTVGRHLAHALCHLEPDLNAGHTHDGKFYKRFHTVSATLPSFTANALHRVPKIVAKTSKELTRAQMWKLDATHRASEAVDKFSRKAAEKSRPPVKVT